MILAGDVGGTKTNLGFFDVHDDQLVSIAEATYSSRDFTSLEGIALDFLQNQQQNPRCACLGVAGPVQNGRCHGVNMPWVVDAARLSGELGIERVRVINDLESTAYSLTALSGSDFVELNAGASDASGNAAVIAAGTGLGEAGMYWDGRRHWPFAGEGGHTDFGAYDDLGAELLRFLIERYGHVSWERVLSGSGLVDLYDFFSGREPGRAADAVAKEIEHEKQGEQGDAAAVISRAALEKRCATCERALDRFVSIYGAEAGNLALTLKATGGVYVGGGIAPKIIDKLKEPLFLEAFVAKGRMRSFMKAIPVYVIMTNRAALIGAAEFARLHLA
jgi:glucokinase